MTRFQILPGLPPYEPRPRAFPAEWGRLGREGVVVAFEREGGHSWVGNFAPGGGSLSAALRHPDGRQVLVIAGGDVWAVDPTVETGELVLEGIGGMWPVTAPDGFVVTWEGLALARLGPDGIVWHTRRLSWDGFEGVTVGEARVTGLAWNPIDDEWQPFEVDLATGAATGGSFGERDTEHWERLAPPRGVA